MRRLTANKAVKRRIGRRGGCGGLGGGVDRGFGRARAVVVVRAPVVRCPSLPALVLEGRDAAELPRRDGTRLDRAGCLRNDTEIAAHVVDRTIGLGEPVVRE